MSAHSRHTTPRHLLNGSVRDPAAPPTFQVSRSSRVSPAADGRHTSGIARISYSLRASLALAACFGGLSLATNASAQAQSPVPGASTSQSTQFPAKAATVETGLPLWELGMFGGYATTPAYPGSADRASRGLVLPFFVYRGEIFRSDNEGFGARLFRTEDQEFNLGFAASLPASSDSIAARKGMPDLGTLIEFGPRYQRTVYRPAPGSRVLLELPLRAVLEFNDGMRSQGVAFEPEISYESRNVAQGWSFQASGSLVYGNSALNNYFYGVSAPYVTATRARYDARAGLIAARLGVSASKAITPDLNVFGFLRLEHYGNSANEASPLFLRTSAASVGIGLAWTFARSEQRAAN